MSEHLTALDVVLNVTKVMEAPLTYSLSSEQDGFRIVGIGEDPNHFSGVELQDIRGRHYHMLGNYTLTRSFTNGATEWIGLDRIRDQIRARLEAATA